MRLTRVERWILANQMSILEYLRSDEKDYFAEAREALEHGYELEYQELAENIYEDTNTLSELECREVIDILSMFDALRISYERLSDKSGIEQWHIAFNGFDGNNETKQMAYAQYFCKKRGGRFIELTNGIDFNSHMLSLDKYRRMIQVWNTCPDKYSLTKNEIINIIG